MWKNSGLDIFFGFLVWSRKPQKPYVNVDHLPGTQQEINAIKYTSMHACMHTHINTHTQYIYIYRAMYKNDYTIQFTTYSTCKMRTCG